jgi:3-oxoadipate enol-lactonase
MQAITVDGTHIHYRLAGRDAGPMLVFVNSLGTDWRVWETVADILGTRSRLLFHDKRGHGLSDVTGGELRMADHVADLATLLEELRIDDAIVCGLSVGGMIALGLAGSRPDLVRGLVLCDTGHRIGTAELWNQRIDMVRRDGMAAIADGVMERWFSPAFREARPAETALWRNMLVRTPAAGYAATCAAIRDADLTAAAGSVTVPALCLCGTLDQSTPPDLVRELAGLIAGSRYRDIPGAAHLPTVEAPDAVAAAVSDFLAEHALA